MSDTDTPAARLARQYRQPEAAVAAALAALSGDVRLAALALDAVDRHPAWGLRGATDAVRRAVRALGIAR